jgi:hypothetical protein
MHFFRQLLLVFAFFLFAGLSIGQNSKPLTREQAFDTTSFFLKGPKETALVFVKRILPPTYKLQTQYFYEIQEGDSAIGKTITFYYELPLSPVAAKQGGGMKFLHEVILSPIDKSGHYQKISANIVSSLQVKDSLYRKINACNFKETLKLLNDLFGMNVDQGGSYVNCHEGGSTTVVSLHAEMDAKNNWAYVNCFNLCDMVITIVPQGRFPKDSDLELHANDQAKNKIIPGRNIFDKKITTNLKLLQSQTCGGEKSGNVIISFGIDKSEIRKVFLLFKHLQALACNRGTPGK